MDMVAMVGVGCEPMPAVYQDATAAFRAEAVALAEAFGWSDAQAELDGQSPPLRRFGDRVLERHYWRSFDLHISEVGAERCSAAALWMNSEVAACV